MVLEFTLSVDKGGLLSRCKPNRIIESDIDKTKAAWGVFEIYN